MTGDLNPMAKVYVGGGQLVHKTPKFKHTNSPVWESTTEFLCSDKSSSSDSSSYSASSYGSSSRGRRLSTQVDKLSYDPAAFYRYDDCTV